MAALRGAKRYSDYLIDRAASSTPAALLRKVKAMNFLLRTSAHEQPYPARRVRRGRRPEAWHDSAILLQDLKQQRPAPTVGLQHRAEPSARPERVLLRALCCPNPIGPGPVRREAC